MAGFCADHISSNTQGTLAVASSAFQALLTACNKQPAQSRQAGFRQYARKQRMEFRLGDDSLGQLGSLQQAPSAGTLSMHSMRGGCRLLEACLLYLCLLELA